MTTVIILFVVLGFTLMGFSTIDMNNKLLYVGIVCIVVSIALIFSVILSKENRAENARGLKEGIAQEMTIEQIQNKLGHKVKIVE